MRTTGDSNNSFHIPRISVQMVSMMTSRSLRNEHSIYRILFQRYHHSRLWYFPISANVEESSMSKSFCHFIEQKKMERSRFRSVTFIFHTLSNTILNTRTVNSSEVVFQCVADCRTWIWNAVLDKRLKTSWGKWLWTQWFKMKTYSFVRVDMLDKVLEAHLFTNSTLLMSYQICHYRKAFRNK